MPVTWSDEKLILLYCPGRGSNSRPSAHRGFKHGQGVPRPYSLVPESIANFIFYRKRARVKWYTYLIRVELACSKQPFLKIFETDIALQSVKIAT